MKTISLALVLGILMTGSSFAEDKETKKTPYVVESHSASGTETQVTGKANEAEPRTPKPKGYMIALPDLRHADVFDGLDPKEADRFWDRWRLVTVRYRKDNGEQRFVYANQLAWAAIESRAETYPEGAMFGKIAAMTEADPLFPNSLAPYSSVRIQLMRKDAKAFAKHDGWGYAVYATGGNDHPPGVSEEAFKTEQSKATEACHACHKIAHQRDYVFTLPAFFSRIAPKENGFKESFTPVDTSRLSPLALEAIDSVSHPRSGQIRIFSMPLFVGSLNESIGPLSEFAWDTKETYLLIDETRGYFLIARPLLPVKAGCHNSVQMTMKTDVKRHDPPHDNIRIIHKGATCDGVLKWESFHKE